MGRDKFTFKTRMKEEANNIMFGRLKTKAARSGFSLANKTAPFTGAVFVING